MTTIHEIQQVMYVETIHGLGIPLFLIDYGPHINTVWVITNCVDGKIKHYDSNDIILTKNNTFNLNNKSKNK